METYLAQIPDSVTMTPEVFIGLMKRFRHHRSIKYGFSKKHTEDIQAYRKKQGLGKHESTIPGNLYTLPVTWNTEITYAK